MKILFITSSRIGDAVLSSGLLAHIEASYPQARVTIACGPLVQSLFEGYPLLDRVIPLKKERRNGHWVKLWQGVIGTRWDIVIDLRDSAVSRLIWGREKHIFSRRIDKQQHKAKQCADVMGLADVPAPKLWFADAQVEKARAIIPDGAPVLGVGPTANWIGKTWPVERFIEVMRYMLDTHMKGARVAVFGAPGEEADAYTLYNALPEDRCIDCIAKGSPGEAAAMIARMDFYIGNDSGLMHCAAAAGVKTLGLFGPSYDLIYAPYGQDFIRTPESFDELIDFEGYDAASLDRSLMTSLSVEAVKAKLDDMFKP
ncbi:MAG: glycosyltransferase family 9 protein [Alphaproteobacteria bacterium]